MHRRNIQGKCIVNKLKIGQGPDRVLLEESRAVRDQELLPRGADLFGLSVFGQGSQRSLHGAELIDPFHPDEQIEFPALFVAVEGARARAVLREDPGRADHVVHSVKRVQSGSDHKIPPGFESVFRAPGGACVRIVFPERAEKLAERRGGLRRGQGVFLHGRGKIGEPGVQLLGVVDLGHNEDDAVGAEGDRFDHQRIIFRVKAALDRSLFHHIAEQGARLLCAVSKFAEPELPAGQVFTGQDAADLAAADLLYFH